MVEPFPSSLGSVCQGARAQANRILDPCTPMVLMLDGRHPKLIYSKLKYVEPLIFPFIFYHTN